MRRHPLLLSLSVGALDPRERLSHVYFGGEWQTGNTVSFGGPGSQISNLTTLATEWTPGVLFPSCGSVAQRTGHGASVAWWPDEEKSGRSRSILWNRSGSGQAEQPLQPASIQVCEAHELDAEFAVLDPSNGGGMDGDRSG